MSSHQFLNPKPVNGCDISLYPLILKPIFKEKPWGGRRLGTLLGKNLPPGKTIGESWELAIRQEEKSVITNGPLSGKTLFELGNARGEDLYGISPVTGTGFPLLIKFIDAKDTLSVQVHPDDKYVLLHEDAGDSGKDEMWYILHAEPESGITLGLREGTTSEEIVKSLESNKPRDLQSQSRKKTCFNEIPVKEGDAFYVPAGMVHAIGRGIVLAEIQQNSDITYRLYDWDRVDNEGKPRELHIKKALDVINYSYTNVRKLDGVTTYEGKNKKTLLLDCPSFVIELQEINQETNEETSDNFSVISLLEGGLTIRWGAGKTDALKGETVFIPACLSGYRLLPDVSCRILTARVA